MTYAVGGNIEASDYNTFLGGNTSNVSGSVNSIWSTGYGNAGYGQTSNLANVTINDTVTAQQWNSLTYVINKITNHQGNANSNVSLVSVGSNIAYQANLPATLANIYNNRLVAYETGNITNYLQQVTLRANGNQSYTGNISFNIAFEDADKARYFFNAGGNIDLSYYAFDGIYSTPRESSIETLVSTNFATKIMLANEFTPRLGSGGTVLTDVTTGTAGYYGITSTPVEKFRVGSASYYSGDTFLLQYSNSGSNGVNGGNGNEIDINAVVVCSNVGATGIYDLLDANLTLKLTVNEPEIEHLTKSWGNITVISTSSPVPSAIPAPSGNAIYTTSGIYNFTVPPGVTSINCLVVGGGGGASGANYYPHFNFWSGLPGGSGGYVSQTLATTPGETLTINVGAAGAPGDYFHIGYGTFICGSSSWSAGNGGNTSVAGSSGSIIATGGYGGNQYSVYVGYVGGTNPGANGGLGGSPNGVNGSIIGYNFVVNGIGFYPGGSNGTGYGSGGSYNGGCPTAAQSGAVVLQW